jgi:hypothetical protein
LLFLIYLLWTLVKERKCILFIYSLFNVYYDGKGGNFLVDTIHIPTSSNTEFWNETLWCLFDTRGKTDDHLYDIPYELGTFITSTFPRQDFLYNFLDEAKIRMRELLASCEGNPLMFKLLGGIFKINVLELLERGGHFC